MDTMAATAKDLRFHSKELLEAVTRGAVITITYRGKPCAQLKPLETAHKISTEEEEKFFGLWKDHDDISVEDYVRSLRRGRYENERDNS